ncbi:hypothetical protein [Pseudomonas extremorientalis]|uniref:Uncharacterized protein n=1 Tax=Pseudomonas extremorientalis TaxID=169669 RepID=A0A1H0KYG4_9PSED|nr:hypothetical protein [Pseudomonas extremorientalis]KAB0517515.1 hypothetical protein F7R08_17990 [Pseudomonas extremorientalis]OIN05056.1 hypothetical protein BFN10_24420 [Pseudomonas extremorientalis]SDO61084.1 hypothetical protein SAMN04490184_0983 [Pseudomonas extremorientalis]
MIGVPMPNPRDSIIDNLNQQLEAFFGAGNKAQEIAPGVSGEVGGPIKSTRSNKLRVERDKIAPKLKEAVESGASLHQACLAAGIDYKRARLIACENGFKLPSNP